MFYDVFTKFAKSEISFVMSDFPHGTTRFPKDGFSGQFIFEDFSIIFKENAKLHQNLTRYSGYFTCVPMYIYGNISLNYS